MLVNLCGELNKLRWDDPNRQAWDKTFNAELIRLDNEVASLPDGKISPGRVLRFQVADGYALYIITKVSISRPLESWLCRLKWPFGIWVGRTP